MQAPSILATVPHRLRLAPPRDWQRVALGVVMLIAILCNFAGLTNNGYGNLYYAAAVKSMTQSWHNFFFVAFDPGGFVSVDKPPVALWIQAASARIFGFSSLSLLAPEAIAGVLAVLLLYHMVRRTFGVGAGLLAALALAIAPVSVVVNRDNLLESILALTVLGAAWAMLRAAETGSLRWLLLSAALAGVGFNVKTLEAYLVVPALGAVYLFGAPLPWRARLLHLLAAVAVLAAISLVWITAVDLTPASARPFVGSSTTNSEFALTFGYNGITRLTGQSTTGAGGPGAFFSGETGPAGIWRMFDTQIGSQVSWLIPLAMFALLAGIWHLHAPLKALDASLRQAQVARGGALYADAAPAILGAVGDLAGDDVCVLLRRRIFPHLLPLHDRARHRGTGGDRHRWPLAGFPATGLARMVAAAGAARHRPGAGALARSVS